MPAALALVPTDTAHPPSLRARADAIKLTMGEIARVTGLNKSTVSYLCNGHRMAHTRKARQNLDAIEAIIAEHERGLPTVAQSGARDALDFAVRGQRELTALLDDTYRYKELSVLAGASGGGKTAAIKQWMAGRTDVLYVTTPERNPYVTLIETVLRALHASTHSGHHSSSKGQQRIVALLKIQNIKMIVVDEADLMLRSHRIALQHKVGLFRELWNEGEGVAVALVGLPTFLKGLDQIIETYLWSRIGHAIEVARPTREELRAYWLWKTGAATGGKNDKYIDEAVRLAEGRGNFRLLNKIHARAENIGLPDALALFARRGMGE